MMKNAYLSKMMWLGIETNHGYTICKWHLVLIWCIFVVLMSPCPSLTLSLCNDNISTSLSTIWTTKITRDDHIHKKAFVSPAGLSWKVKIRVDVPRPPDVVSNTTGPDPTHGFVTTTSFAGLWYSRVGKRSQPLILIEHMSSFDLPRLHPRTVILVPPDVGPDLGESPVISGALLEDKTWPRVGARRGLKRVKGCRVVALPDGETTGDSFGLEGPDFKGPLLSRPRFGFKSRDEYKFSIDLEPFIEIEAASIEDLRFERSFEPVLRLNGNKLFHLTPSPTEEGFLKESTQQSMHRSPIACEFFVVNGIHRRRWATDGICARGKLTVPSESSRSVTVKIRGAALVTFLKKQAKAVTSQ